MDPADMRAKSAGVANRNQLHFAPGDPYHSDRGESKSEMISRARLLTQISRCISQHERAQHPSGGEPKNDGRAVGEPGAAKPVTEAEQGGETEVERIERSGLRIVWDSYSRSARSH